MSVHLRREIEQLKKQALSLSALVEESVLGAVRAIERRDAAAAATLMREHFAHGLEAAA